MELQAGGGGPLCPGLPGPLVLGPPPDQLCPAASPTGPRLAASLARPVASNPSTPESQVLEPQRQMLEMG